MRKTWIAIGLSAALLLSGGSVYAASAGKQAKQQDPTVEALKQQISTKEQEVKGLRTQLKARLQELAEQHKAAELQKLQAQAAKLGIDTAGKSAADLKAAIKQKLQEKAAERATEKAAKQQKQKAAS